MIIKLVFNITGKKIINKMFKKKKNIKLAKQIKAVLMCLYVAVVILVGINIEDTHSFFADTLNGLNNTFTTTDSLPPPTPTQEFPDNGAVMNSADLYFDWTDETYWYGSLTAIYDFQLDEDLAMTAPILFENNSTDYSRYPETGMIAALGEGSYFWRVRACKQIPEETDCSTWSPVREIIVDNSAPITEITSPAVGDTIPLDSMIDIRVNIDDAHPDTWLLTARDSNGDPISNGSFPDMPGVMGHPYVDELLFSWDTTGLPEGSYFISLEAWDEAGNHAPAVDPSSMREIIIDRTFFSIITVANSPEKEIENRLINSSFEKHLDDWDSEGDVKIIKKDDNSIEAYAGKRMLRMGDADLKKLDSDEIFKSSVTQTIDNSGYGIRSISFWVNYLANKVDENEAGFKVYVNDKLRHQIWDNDISETSTGWQFVSLYVVDDKSKELELKFETSGDTVVYIDDINTDVVFVDSNAIFTIRGEEKGEIDSVHYLYYIDGEEYHQTGAEGTEMKLVGQPDDNRVEYWSVDRHGNEEEHRFLEVHFDEEAPNAVNDLSVEKLKDDTFKLKFTSPKDDLMGSASGYDIRYSLSPITEQTNWDSLQRVHLVNSDSVSGILTAPRRSGKAEKFVIDQLRTKTMYYFAVISKDATKNWSEVSNIAVYDPNGEVLGIDTEPTPTPILTQSTVSFNELSYHGEEEQYLPDEEWIEFYNSSDEAISMEEWSIQDENGHEVIIEKDNSDVDLNYLNEGEIEIPANGYLVVFTDDLNLDDLSHTSLFLYDSEGNILDSIFYQGDFEEYSSQAKYVEEGNVFWHYQSLPTPGRKNARSVADLDPTARLFWQEPYNAMIAVMDADLYDSAEYELQYDHLSVDGGDNLITELITDRFSLKQGRTEETNIYLTTCSSDGICIPHSNIEPDSFILRAVLSNDFGDEKELTLGLTGEWEQ